MLNIQYLASQISELIAKKLIKSISILCEIRHLVDLSKVKSLLMDTPVSGQLYVRPLCLKTRFNSCTNSVFQVTFSYADIPVSGRRHFQRLRLRLFPLICKLPWTDTPKKILLTTFASCFYQWTSHRRSSRWFYSDHYIPYFSVCSVVIQSAHINFINEIPLSWASFRKRPSMPYAS